MGNLHNTPIRQHILPTATFQIKRGQYMTINLVMPQRAQAAVQIAYTVSHSPFSREEAERLASQIQKLPHIMAALDAVNLLFDGEDIDQEKVIMLLEKALD